MDPSTASLLQNVSAVEAFPSISAFDFYNASLVNNEDGNDNEFCMRGDVAIATTMFMLSLFLCITITCCSLTMHYRRKIQGLMKYVQILSKEVKNFKQDAQEKRFRHTINNTIRNSISTSASCVLTTTSDRLAPHDAQSVTPRASLRALQGATRGEDGLLSIPGVIQIDTNSPRNLMKKRKRRRKGKSRSKSVSDSSFMESQSQEIQSSEARSPIVGQKSRSSIMTLSNKSSLTSEGLYNTVAASRGNPLPVTKAAPKTKIINIPSLLKDPKARSKDDHSKNGHSRSHRRKKRKKKRKSRTIFNSRVSPGPVKRSRSKSLETFSEMRSNTTITPTISNSSYSQSASSIPYMPAASIANKMRAKRTKNRGSAAIFIPVDSNGSAIVDPYTNSASNASAFTPKVSNGSAFTKTLSNEHPLNGCAFTKTLSNGHPLNGSAFTKTLSNGHAFTPTISTGSFTPTVSNNQKSHGAGRSVPINRVASNPRLWE